jgi:hypothetical protein
MLWTTRFVYLIIVGLVSHVYVRKLYRKNSTISFFGLYVIFFFFYFNCACNNAVNRQLRVGGRLTKDYTALME